MLTVEQLAESYINTLENKNHPHDAFVIGFAAVPGSGKTTLAMKLAQDLDAIRVNKDSLNELWEQIDPEHPEDPQNPLVQTVYQIVNTLLTKYPNKLVVLDSSLDRKYAETKQILDQRQVKLFVISLDIPREVLVERIKRRNGDAAQPYLDKLDGWITDHQTFLQTYQPDFSFSGDEDYPSLVKKLTALIEV
jgi:predicted kinase